MTTIANYQDAIAAVRFLKKVTGGVGSAFPAPQARSRLQARRGNPAGLLGLQLAIAEEWIEHNESDDTIMLTHIGDWAITEWIIRSSA